MPMERKAAVIAAPDAGFPAAMEAVPARPGTWDEYRAAWREAEAGRVLTAHPLHLDLELVSLCNLKCSMCWQSTGVLDAPMGTMDDALFKTIIDRGVAQGLCAIKLQSRGESMLHPRIGELARYAKAAGVMDVQLTTNGTLLGKPEKFETLAASGIDKVIFSIDEAHDASARAIYGEDAPDVRTLARRFRERRDALGAVLPKIRIQTFAPPGVTHDQRMAQIQAEFPGFDEYLVNTLWNSNALEDSIDNLSRDYDFLPCSYLWTRMVVYWNGDVTTCCRDYNCTMKLGNAGEDDIGSIWLGEPMMRLRRMHTDGRRRTIPICAHCEVCTRPRAARSDATAPQAASM